MYDSLYEHMNERKELRENLQNEDFKKKYIELEDERFRDSDLETMRLIDNLLEPELDTSPIEVYGEPDSNNITINIYGKVRRLTING